MKYYKWTADGKPVYGKGTYDLSGGWQPRIENKLVECERGYHVCREDQLSFWCGDGLHEVEIDESEPVVCENKMIVRTWRLVRTFVWSRQDMIEYANWCASRAGVHAAAATFVADTAAADAAADAAAERKLQHDWILARVAENERADRRIRRRYEVMCEHPILFRADMIQAILDGRKTVTRRVMCPQPDPVLAMVGVYETAHGSGKRFVRCPYGVCGDRLWIKRGRFGRKTESVGWLRVTSVLGERLQQITQDEARCEGCADLADFVLLWDSINAARGFPWASNPWVWVIRFTVEK